MPSRWSWWSPGCPLGHRPPRCGKAPEQDEKTGLPNRPQSTHNSQTKHELHDTPAVNAFDFAAEIHCRLVASILLAEKVCAVTLWKETQMCAPVQGSHLDLRWSSRWCWDPRPTRRGPSQLQTVWYLLLFRFILWDQAYCDTEFFLSSFKANNI